MFKVPHLCPCQSMIRVTCSTKYTIHHSTFFLVCTNLRPAVRQSVTVVFRNIISWQLSWNRLHQIWASGRCPPTIGRSPVPSHWPASALSDPCCYKLTGQTIFTWESQCTQDTPQPHVATITHRRRPRPAQIDCRSGSHLHNCFEIVRDDLEINMEQQS